MGIAFVIFMAIFIKCFAIHTPSSNPRLAKNLHFTETLRRPVRALQQKVNFLKNKEFNILTENEKDINEKIYSF